MQKAKKQLVFKKYTHYILILISIFLLNFNPLKSMEEDAPTKKRTQYLSTKFQPSEKFLTSNPNYVDYFASLPLESLALITSYLIKNSLYQEETDPNKRALRNILKDVTSFALLNKAMMSIFSVTESDFANQITTCLVDNIYIGNIYIGNIHIGNIRNIRIRFNQSQELPTTKINDRKKLIVPFLKHALKTTLFKQETINYEWRESLQRDKQKALETLPNYQELIYAPDTYYIFGLNGFILDNISTLFSIFYSGVEQKKIHYHSSIQVKKFYDWHVERRSHYCTLLSFALDMINFSNLQDKPFDFITLLTAQGADPHKECTIPSCKYPTPWQEAKVIQAKHPQVLALLSNGANQFMTKSE